MRSEDHIEVNARLLLSQMVERQMQQCSNYELLQIGEIKDGQDINDALERLEQEGAIEIDQVKSTVGSLALGAITLKPKGKSLYRQYKTQDEATIK
jgi:hypothetical protein